MPNLFFINEFKLRNFWHSNLNINILKMKISTIIVVFLYLYTENPIIIIHLLLLKNIKEKKKW